MIKDIIKLSVFLTIACAIAAAALSITYVTTSERIAVQKKAEVNSAISNDCLPGCINIKEVKDHYEGFDKNGKKIGYAFRVSPQGYGGAIDMAVGIDIQGRVLGIKIISMKETPGLGSKASEPSFLAQFTGKTSISPLKAKKDIDAITGATITSQAVSNGVREALKRFRQIL